MNWYSGHLSTDILLNWGHEYVSKVSCSCSCYTPSKVLSQLVFWSDSADWYFYRGTFTPPSENPSALSMTAMGEAACCWKTATGLCTWTRGSSAWSSCVFINHVKQFYIYFHPGMSARRQWAALGLTEESLRKNDSDEIERGVKGKLHMLTFIHRWFM